VRDGYPGWDGQGGTRRIAVPSANTLVQVCEANERRIALILGSPPSGTAGYTTDVGADATAAGFGLLVGTGVGNLVLTRAQHGGLVTRAWFYATGTAPSGVAISEAFE